jgi:hypothetical protein
MYHPNNEWAEFHEFVAQKLVNVDNLMEWNFLSHDLKGVAVSSLVLVAWVQRVLQRLPASPWQTLVLVLACQS